LFEVAGQLGLGADDQVLDAGCGEGSHACRLAQQFSCQVTGLDPAESNLARAKQLAVEMGLSGRVSFQPGVIEEIPFTEKRFDLIWCRDMLVHVRQLGVALRECHRVLKDNGTLLIYTVLATDLLEPKEAFQICVPLQVIIDNLVQPYLEQIFKAAGWQIALTMALGSEPVEYLEAENKGQYARALKRIALMRRQRERFVAELGQAEYEQTLALYQWDVYQFLGKLSQTIYILKKKDPFTLGVR
jgi:ubiquinone/menaquinone biosynthesis C-methylase UbiE